MAGATGSFGSVRPCRAALAGVLVAALACAEDEVEIPESRYGEPWCMWVIDSRGHWDDGRSRPVSIENTTASATGVACLCLSEEEYETQARHDELNDLALEVCNSIAAQYDFDWDECQMDHDSERWLDFVFPSAGRYARLEGDALGCVGEP